MDYTDIKNVDDKDKSMYLKLVPGKYVLRLLGKPEDYKHHWENQKKYACLGMDGCPHCKKTDTDGDGSNRPRTSYVTNVFVKLAPGDDPKDIDPQTKLRKVPELMLLEKGRQIFGTFGAWARAREINPGGEKGPDWQLIVEKTGPEVRNVRYQLFPLDIAPLTNEEKKILKAQNLYDVKKIVSDRIEKYKKELDGESGPGLAVDDTDIEGLDDISLDDVDGILDEIDGDSNIDLEF